jgi:hypothetical protein
MIRLSAPLGIAAALAGAVVLASPTDASACGGSFSRPPPDPQNPETIEIAAQRMVLSISEAQTVLWSQIEYEGPPEEFAWVLPVGPGSTIELANPVWFEALEAVSSTHVAPPGVCGPAPIYGESSSGGCSPGCAAGSADSGGVRGLPQEEEDKSSVDVVSRGTLGPYETVTLSSKDGQAVKDWLITNGYAVPADVAPILDEYTMKGMDFIALRLKPDSSTGQMQPVRVVTKGASPMIPFRMMVAGARETVPVTLYVISEGRYAPQSYPEAALDAESIRWDFAAEKSNYTEARDAVLKASEGGRGFLTTYVQSGGLHATVVDHRGAPVELRPSSSGSAVAASLAELYYKMADAANELTGGACEGNMQQLFMYEATPVEDCEPEACPGGGQSKVHLECEGAKDLAAALIGMRPRDAWVTRLEANLPREGLTADLTLAPAAAQEAMPSWIVAGEHENCDEEFYATASLDMPGSRRMNAGWMAAAFAFGATLLRRRGRAGDLRILFRK